MPLDLSQLDRSVLPRSPLTTVVCQVRFNQSPAASDATVAQQLYEELGGRDGPLPHIEQVAETSINVSLGANVPASIAQQAGGSGWRISSAEGDQTILLFPSAITFEVARYEGWEEDFSPRLETILRNIAELVAPVFEQRLGLRYINQLTEPEVREAPAFQEWLDPRFLGLAAHDEIGPLVVFARQQAVLQLDDEARCTMTHGLAPDPQRDGALTYLLDFDIAREGMRRFDVGEISDGANLFNAYALRLFQLATTAQLREYLAQ